MEMEMYWTTMDFWRPIMVWGVVLGAVFFVFFYCVVRKFPELHYGIEYDPFPVLWAIESKSGEKGYTGNYYDQGYALVWRFWRTVNEFMPQKTVNITVPVTGHESQGGDMSTPGGGPQVFAGGELLVATDPEYAHLYQRQDLKRLSNQLIARAQSILDVIIAKYPPEYFVGNRDRLQGEADGEVSSQRVRPNGTMNLRNLGLKVVEFVVTRPDFGSKIQEAVEAEFVAEKTARGKRVDIQRFNERVAQVAKEQDIPREQAIRVVQAQEGKLDRKFWEVPGLDNVVGKITGGGK
jgi:hypothetical protein